MIVGYRGVGLCTRAEHLELEPTHRARSRTLSKNASHCVVRFLPAVEAAPERAQLTHQLVAPVDRYQEALAPRRRAIAPHEERLHVGHQRRELRMIGGHFVPRVEGQERLGRAGRARIERAHPIEGGVHEEERDAHGYLQRVPLAGRQVEIRERPVPVRDRLEVPAAGAVGGEEQPAPPARAHEVALLDVDEVLVLLRYRFAAQLAALAPGAAAAPEANPGSAGAPRAVRPSCVCGLAADGHGNHRRWGWRPLDVDDQDLGRGLDDRGLHCELQGARRRSAPFEAPDETEVHGTGMGVDLDQLDVAVVLGEERPYRLECRVRCRVSTSSGCSPCTISRLAISSSSKRRARNSGASRAASRTICSSAPP